MLVAVFEGRVAEVEFTARDACGRLIDPGLGGLLLLGAVLVGAAHHDVGHLHLAAGGAAVHHLDDVVAEARAHRLADLALRGVVRCRFEWIDHLQCAEPPKVATVLGRAGVVAAALAAGHAGPILPFRHPLAQGADLLPRGQRIGRGGIGGQLGQDVAGADLDAAAVEGLLDQLVVQVAVDQVRTGELLAVAVQFALELAHGVHAEFFGGPHLELVIDEEVEVLVQRLLGDGGVLVVLLVDGLELAARYGLAVNGHQHGVGGGGGKGGDLQH